MRFSIFFRLAALSLLLTQCSIRTMAIREVGDLVADGVPAFERDDDPDLIRDALPANIKLLEAMLESDPENRQLLTLLAQMYASYTFGFVEPELDKPQNPLKTQIRERLNRLYLRGMAYGERALIAAESSCAEGLKVSTGIDACLNKLDKDDVPALFWYGFNVAAYVNRNFNSVSALALGVNIEKSMQRVVALQEDFNFGCAHVLLMAYFGSRSPMMGGSAEKAKEHYEKVQAITEKQFWLADVFYARYVLVQNDDQAGFEALLKAVGEKKAETVTNPRMALYNSLAKTRAKMYLNAVDDLF